MKIIFIFFIIALIEPIYSQQLDNNFKIGNFLEIFDNDSIVVYYNCTGTIVDKKCSQFFRKGKLDSLFLNISGSFKDYYITGEIAFEGTIKNNQLEGKSEYYYKNGNISEKGVYSNNERIGIWNYFYPNGSKLKTFNFIGGEPLVLNYYDKDGIEQVKNGNGYYVGYYNGYKGCSPFRISGKVYDGRMDSVWRFIGDDSEIYDKGKFVKKLSKITVNNDQPMIHLQGFVANENFFISNYLLGCPGDFVYDIKYKGDFLNSTFYPYFSRELKKAINYDLDNQTIMVGIEISMDDKLSQVNIYSSKNDTLTENLIYKLINKTKKSWNTALINEMKIESNILFFIIIEDNKMIISKGY